MRIVTIALCCVLCGLSLLADQVTLSNGDRVTGKVIKKQDDSLTIKSDLLGEVTVKWKDVASVTTDQPLTVGISPEKSIAGTIATAGDKMVVKGPQATEEVPMAQVGTMRDPDEQRKYERYQHPPLTDLWAGAADFSIASAQGNSRTLTTAFAVTAARITDAGKIGLYFNQIYSRGLLNGVVADTASAVRGGWQYNRNINKRMFWNTFNDYEHDRFQSLDLRLVLGSGIGFTAYKGERGELDLVAGGSWNRESYSTPLVPATDTTPAQFLRNSGEAYWGDDLRWSLTKISAFKQSFRMFDNLSNSGEYRANMDIGIDTKLWKMLSWQLTAGDRYITNPAPGRKTNDLLVSSGIRFTFSRLP
jgi:hypothetical protein